MPMSDGQRVPGPRLLDRVRDHEADAVDVRPVDAGPVKRFFIDILTRDVELNDAILDLVDNSVDSAAKLRASGSQDAVLIDIIADSHSFSISDNCAGISVDAAVNYAFRLGRPGDERSDDDDDPERPRSQETPGDGVAGQPRSIGQFGVGMKRSLFKMGTEFTVMSATEDSYFDMHLDVKKWIRKADDWNIDVRVHDLDPDQLPPRGTAIVIHRLIPAVAAALGELVVTNRLKEDLRSKHRMALERGVVIRLNKEALIAEPTVLALNLQPDDLIQPLVERFELEDDEGRTVKVEIYAGVAAKTQTAPGAEPETVQEAERSAGWYVFGNDRLLMGPERSAVTGWAGGRAALPLYHNQFGRFRGYVYMSAEESEALPWNTTKTGVETSDPIWTSVRGEMLKTGREVINLLNQLKEEGSADDRLAKPLTSALEAARNTSVSEVAKTMKDEVSQTLAYPDANPEIVKGKGHRIAYTVDEDAFEAVAVALDVNSAAAVGRATFDYYYDEFVGED